MVAASRDFEAEALRDGTANLNETIYPDSPFGTGIRGGFNGTEARSIVDGLMDGRCGTVKFETDPGGPPFVSNAIGYWYYDKTAGRFITEARATFQINSSASNYLRNKLLWSINGAVGEDYFDLSVNRTANTDPWTIYVNSVDSTVDVPQNAEIDVVLIFDGSSINYVVSVGGVEELNATIAATGLPEELDCVTSGTLTRDLSPGGGSPATGFAYGSVREIFYTLTPYIVTTALPDGYVGTPYTADIDVDADTGAFSVSSGAFPPGLELSAATGEVYGTPVLAGTYEFTVSYEEFDTGEVTGRGYSLTIIPAEVPATDPAWKATLHGVTICGGDCPDDNVVACLSRPPAGTGVPPLRIQDQTYPQRDGVDMFNDYYEPRVLTFEGFIGNGSECGCSGAARQNAYDLTEAWRRNCGDVELVLGTDACTTAMSREILYVNRAYNPSAEISDGDPGGTAHWYAEQSGGISALSTEPYVGEQNAATLHLTDGTINSGIKYGRYTPSVDLIACEPGTQVDVSVQIRSDIEESHTLTIVYVDAGGSVVDATIVDTAVVNDTTWTELSGGDVAPAGTAGISIVVATDDAPLAGQNVEADALMVCFETGLPPAYFDGDTTDDFDDYSGGTIYEWTGEPHNSPSRMVQLTPTVDRDTTGPFGVIGRPRVADVVWRKGKAQVADVLLRFDSVDHRLYVLDADGTPGSGAVCETIDAPLTVPYFEAVADTAPYHHWPLDFPNMGTQTYLGQTIGAATDLIGSFDTAKVYALPDGSGIVGRPTQTTPISFGLSMSAIQGPALHEGRPWSVGYDSGMVGWWQETPTSATAPGSAVSLDGSGDYQLGQNGTGQLAPVIRFGSGDVAMNAETQAAFGFTNTYRGQPVLITLVFVPGTLYIFAAHDATSSPFLIQTVAGSGMPADGGVPSITALTAKISNIMSGMDNYTATPEADGEAIMTALAPYGFGTPSSQVTMPDVGQLCGPIKVTFETGADFGEVYIFKNDGTYVGITSGDALGSDYAPNYLDTETGTATRFYGTMDATPDITGNPFLEVAPGEVLNVFGGGDVTICFRPSVISA